VLVGAVCFFLLCKRGMKIKIQSSNEEIRRIFSLVDIFHVEEKVSRQGTINVGSEGEGE